MDNSKRLEVINHLKDLECCSRCILHHINASPQTFTNPNLYFQQLGLDTVEATEDDCKKLKKNICRLCLDLLEDSTLDEFIYAVSNSHIKEYHYDDFMVMVSVPKSIYVRKHAMQIYLKEKFPETFNENSFIETISRVVRYSVNEKLAKQLGRKFSPRSNFEINVNMIYKNDETDIKNVYNLDRNKFNFKQKGKKSEELISRNFIIEILNDVKDDLFKRHFTTLSEIPDKKVEMSGFTFTAAPIYIGGRYLKFTRTLCQTPWIINNQKVKEHCVQDILFDAIEKVLGKQDKMTFVSSGREDADVRMLGNGRPFYVQIENPKQRHFSVDNYKEIEKEVISSKLMAVTNLQMVYKSDIARIKDGEENKKKTYSALCTTTGENIEEIVDSINSHGMVEIAQKTPIRVLHRRSLSVRQKCIYSMKAKPVPGYKHLFELECETQAGTYVKEFVHGDLERTVPNLGKIVGHPCDIIALDVTKIDLSWPENETKTESEVKEEKS